jgi:pyridoxal phosphate enzyme (YggS family)
MTISDNLARVRQQIAAACHASGRAPSEVTLVAVSKTMPVDRCRAADEAGQLILGENYAQELRNKAPSVPGARWHFIGPLQRNKVKYVVGVAELIHSLDSMALADEIAARARKLGVVQRCLVQVNIAREPQKSGCPPEQLDELLRAVSTLDSILCEGLMCIPPDGKPARPYFDQLAALARAHRLQALSMGMSNDFVEAIAAGATLVRVGIAIFGSRGARHSAVQSK